MAADRSLDRTVTRFLQAWLGARQMIQASNFNRFQNAGLSATQFMTLNLIPDGAKSMTLSELAARMNLGTATVAKTIDSLEDRGLLTRTRSDQDRRVVHLSLTDDGRSMQNAASADFHRHMTALFRKLTPDQRTGLVQGLEALLEASAELMSAGDAPPLKRNSSQSRKR